MDQNEQLKLGKYAKMRLFSDFFGISLMIRYAMPLKKKKLEFKNRGGKKLLRPQIYSRMYS